MPSKVYAPPSSEREGQHSVNHRNPFWCCWYTFVICCRLLNQRRRIHSPVKIEISWESRWILPSFPHSGGTSSELRSMGRRNSRNVLTLGIPVAKQAGGKMCKKGRMTEGKPWMRRREIWQNQTQLWARRKVFQEVRRSANFLLAKRSPEPLKGDFSASYDRFTAAPTYVHDWPHISLDDLMTSRDYGTPWFLKIHNRDWLTLPNWDLFNLVQLRSRK